MPGREYIPKLKEVEGVEGGSFPLFQYDKKTQDDQTWKKWTMCRHTYAGLAKKNIRLLKHYVITKVMQIQTKV